jgi:hypothetical protein
VILAVASLAVLMATTGSAAESVGPAVSKFTPTQGRQMAGGASQSGVYDFNDQDLGTRITECPQAGNTNQNKELRRRQVDGVEQTSGKGDDKRSNDDYSCFPQNEVSVDFNPLNTSNFLIGANDYRLGTGSSGFHATTNGGKSFYNGIIPFPSAPPAQSRGEGFVISGGDPVSVFDRAGIAYYAQIAFFRGDDTNGVFAQRSTNGGFTWSRACVPVGPGAGGSGATDANAVCGGPGDARQPGDGRVNYNPDNDLLLNGSVPFDDKEYMENGPRPAGVAPVCFTPVTRLPIACNPDVVGVDRLYVTWTRFTANASQINISFSDDQARSWSPPRVINGSASFCAFSAVSATGCDDNQFSVPTAHGKTGVLYVAFENFNTPDENQVLMVRSTDGGVTFSPPFFVSSVFDLNFPRSGVTRPDCAPRGQQNGRIVYTNSCFRSNPSGNIVVDERSSAFADDLYYVLADNRNGNLASSNSDVFIFKSINGGSTWTSPTRVNNDRSVTPTMTDPFGPPFNRTGRDCARPPGSIGPGFPQSFAATFYAACGGDFGADQWWPWADIGRGGELNVAFKDRRLDTNSMASEWPTSRQRAGNYLVWTWGAQCKVSRADSTECLAPGTTFVPQPIAPVDPGADPVPGQGNAFLGTFKNHQVSDVPSNFDYSFRAGIFAGDYENIVVVDSRGSGDDDDDGGGGAKAINVFTDARNGRSSRNQPGRNPICEQSDIFFDIYSALNAGSDRETTNYAPFLVTPCPAQAIDPKQDDDDDDDDDD